MSDHNHITRDIKPQGQCPGCDTYHASQKPKVVIKREILVDADLDPATSVMSPENLDFGDDQTFVDWLAEQKEHGETAMDFAKELDLFEGVSIHFQIVEYYEDGTHRCVDRGEWKDGSADQG